MKIFLKLISILLALTALRCEHTFEIPDLKTHVIRHDHSVKWFTSNSGKIGKMSKEVWKKEGIGMACYDDEDYRKLFLLFDDVCQRNPCSQEIREAIENFKLQYYDFSEFDGFEYIP